jgi:hypothetical protein
MYIFTYKFVVYLTTVSIGQRRIVKYLANMVLERTWKEAVVEWTWAGLVSRHCARETAISHDK